MDPELRETIVAVAPCGPTALATFLYLASQANAQGECSLSVPTIACDLWLSDRTVRRAIDALEEAKHLEVQPTDGQSNRYRLITPDKSAKGNEHEPLTKAPGDPCQICEGTPSANGRGPLTKAPEVKRTNTKKINTRTRTKTRKRKYQRKRNTTPSKLSQELRPAFECFYRRYPRREDRVDAERAFAKAVNRLIQNGDDEKFAAELLIERAGAYERQCVSLGTDRQFIKLPATWLNKGSYLDEQLNAYAPATNSQATSRTENYLKELGIQ